MSSSSLLEAYTKLSPKASRADVSRALTDIADGMSALVRCPTVAPQSGRLQQRIEPVADLHSFYAAPLSAFDTAARSKLIKLLLDDLGELRKGKVHGSRLTTHGTFHLPTA